MSMQPVSSFVGASRFSMPPLFEQSEIMPEIQSCIISDKIESIKKSKEESKPSIAQDAVKEEEDEEEQAPLEANFTKKYKRTIEDIMSIPPHELPNRYPILPVPSLSNIE